ncbi:glycosyltransferase [Rhodobacter maris]|uniref:Glycosyl transferase family 2 n=1 Tax=Rhodobacter maris TaxID=446682 RepID=A0A285T9F6_9RHOB|nr:glycosyltransferase [Rhodobacter maris]SOC18199.1 glycosyl transferase family 2 [Rhodobacter maris]
MTKTGASNTAAPHVVILMATYEGAECLRAQLDSFVAQTHGNWSLLVGDDGSRDATREILAGFAAEGHALRLIEGPRRGAAANFMALLREAAQSAPPGAWIAFSDQDDVWLPDRLARGIAALSAAPGQGPGLFCSRTFIVDHALQTPRLSVPRPRPLGFRNALVQNVVAGNTILLDAAGAALVLAASAEAARVVVHDWWVYQILSGCGGRIVHDDTPTLLYRQHAANEIGANDSRRAQMQRLGMLLRGTMRDWTTINIAALSGSRHRFTPENRALFDAFAALRGRSVPARLIAFARLRLYRQTRISTLALWVSVLVGLM